MSTETTEATTASKEQIKLNASTDMHLAAYMKYHGAQLLRYDKGRRTYTFESEVSEMDWRVRHSNSCCVAVDNELLRIKRLLD